MGLLATLDRAPVLRVDYRRDMYAAPAAHIQVHAHRGALSHLLSQAEHPFPHDMSALHIPIGGARFRPCLEDFIQFLIAECRFDSLPDWQHCVREGRRRWRRRQAAAVTRDMPEEAARVIRELGYKVESPEPPLQRGSLRVAGPAGGSALVEYLVGARRGPGQASIWMPVEWVAERRAWAGGTGRMWRACRRSSRRAGVSVVVQMKARTARAVESWMGRAFSRSAWLAAMDSVRIAMPRPRAARSTTAPGELA